jgi:hypothetical protein
LLVCSQVDRIPDPVEREILRQLCEDIELLQRAKCYAEYVERLAQCPKCPPQKAPSPVVLPSTFFQIELNAQRIKVLAPSLFRPLQPIPQQILNEGASAAAIENGQVDRQVLGEILEQYEQAKVTAGGDLSRYFREILVKIESALAPLAELPGNSGELPGNAPSHPVSYVAKLRSDGGEETIRGTTTGFGQYSVFVGSESRVGTVAFYDPVQRAYGLIFPNETSTARYKLPRFYLVPIDDSFPDSDDDGLPDVVEDVYGTDPTKFSTANDGVSDGAKVAAGISPLGNIPVATGIISNLPIPGTANEVVLEGSLTNSGQQTAYVAAGSGGLAIINASQFQRPILLSRLALPGDATDVSVDSNLQIAAVAATSGGLHFVDVSDPLNPALLRTINASASQVEVVEGIAYATVASELRSYDLLTGEKLQSLVPGTSNLTGLAREGSYLYTMDAGSQLRAIDISGPSMILRGALTMPAGGSKLFVGNGVAYIAAYNGFNAGFATANVSNPNSLTLISDVDAPNIVCEAIAANGSGLAVTVGTVLGPNNQSLNALDVVNVSDPANTGNFITRFPFPVRPRSVAIGSGIAFVAAGTAGLQVVNYRAFDNQGVAPTVSIATSAFDVDPIKPGLQVQEGSSVPVQATISDDVQVRNVNCS